jgi:hypothetical protein
LGGGGRAARKTTTVYSTGRLDPAHGAASWTPRHRHAGPRYRRTLPVQWVAFGEVPHREKRIRWCVPPPAPAGAALPPDAAGPTGTDGRPRSSLVVTLARLVYEPPSSSLPVHHCTRPPAQAQQQSPQQTEALFRVGLACENFLTKYRIECFV